MKLILSLLRENARLKENFKKYKANKRLEVDREISNILSKYVFKIGGGLLALGYFAGRFSK